MTPLQRRGLAMQAVWNLRALGFFLIGPVIGVWLGVAIFGMPRTLQIIAAVVFLLNLTMFTMLIRGECKRLSRGR